MMEFKHKILLTNIRRLKVVALVGTFINLVLIAINIKSFGILGISTADSIIRILWISASLLYILLAGNPKEISDIKRRHSFIFFGAAMLSLFFSGLIMVATDAKAGYTFVYIVNCMVTCSFFYLSFWEMFMLLMPTLSFLTFVLIYFDNTALNYLANSVNMYVVSLFALIISAFSYKSQAELFSSQEIIKRQNITLRTLAEIDGLTGIPNRRKFDEKLIQEWAGAKRSREPLSLLLLDIDFFKAYNDHYGHLAGDDCLKKVASILQKSLQRQTDLLARYGGEEFIILLRDTDKKGALYLAEQIQSNMKEANIAHEASSFKYVSLSIGIATYYGEPNMDKNKFLDLADKAMYRAKNEGRNRYTD